MKPRLAPARERYAAHAPDAAPPRGTIVRVSDGAVALAYGCEDPRLARLAQTFRTRERDLALVAPSPTVLRAFDLSDGAALASLELGPSWYVSGLLVPEDSFVGLAGQYGLVACRADGDASRRRLALLDLTRLSEGAMALRGGWWPLARGAAPPRPLELVVGTTRVTVRACEPDHLVTFDLAAGAVADAHRPDPIAALVADLKSHGRPDFGWVLRWSRFDLEAECPLRAPPGPEAGAPRDPVATAWRVSRDGDAMVELLRIAADDDLIERVDAALEADQDRHELKCEGLYGCECDRADEVADVVRGAAPAPPPFETVVARAAER